MAGQLSSGIVLMKHLLPLLLVTTAVTAGVSGTPVELRGLKRTPPLASSSGKKFPSSSPSLGEKKRTVCPPPGVTTNERNNCFNVQVTCGRDRMKASFSSAKSFTGKIYSSRAPATCSQVLEDMHSFSIDVPYFTALTTASTPTSTLHSTHRIFSPVNRRKASSPEPFSPGFTDCGVTATSVRGGRDSDQEEWSRSVPGEEKKDRRHVVTGYNNAAEGHAVGKKGSDLQKHEPHQHPEPQHHRQRYSHRHQSYHNLTHDPQAVKDDRLNSSSASSDVSGRSPSLRPTFARFSVSLVLQRHALIVTSADFDITLNCDYNLSSQKIVSNSIQLFSHSPNEPQWNELEEVQAVPATGPSGNKVKHPANMHKPPAVMQPIPPPVGGTGVGSVVPVPHTGVAGDPLTHEATFHSPVVRMSIKDRNGEPVRSAEVGDPLSLRFEVYSEHGQESMYDVFVKNIVADDGVNTSELELIDDRGCPTDPSIMGPLRRVHASSITRKVLDAPFEAFKFPTSAIVQFRALIVPCIAGDCQPVVCTISTSALSSSNLIGHATFASGSKSAVHSFGKRSLPDDAAVANNERRARGLIPSPLSNESSVAMDQLSPPRELEERIFIEVVDKKEEEDDERSQQAAGVPNGRPEASADNHDEEIGNKSPDDNNRSNKSSNNNSTTSSQGTGERRRRMRKKNKGRNESSARDSEAISSSGDGDESSSNCFSLPPMAWLCCGLCLLCVQLVCLMRFYFSSRRDARFRSRYGFRAWTGQGIGKDPADCLSFNS